MTGTDPQPAPQPVRSESNGASRAPIVWIDCEMTGLDLGSDALVEIACIVTDADLNALDEGIAVVIAPPPDALAGMSEFVESMHRESGLLPLIPDGEPLERAAMRILEYVRSHVPEPRKAPLGGSSVYVDRSFLARDMPDLDEHLHYRVIDVSSVKELVKRWYPGVYYRAPVKTGGHRALGDILDSVAELRYYREAVMIPR